MVRRCLIRAGMFRCGKVDLVNRDLALGIKECHGSGGGRIRTCKKMTATDRCRANMAPDTYNQGQIVALVFM